MKKLIHVHIVGTPSTMAVEITPGFRAGKLLFKLDLVGWPLTVEYNDFPINPMEPLDFEDGEVIYAHLPEEKGIADVLRFLRCFSAVGDKRKGGE